MPQNKKNFCLKLRTPSPEQLPSVITTATNAQFCLPGAKKFRIRFQQKFGQRAPAAGQSSSGRLAQNVTGWLGPTLSRNARHAEEAPPLVSHSCRATRPAPTKAMLPSSEHHISGRQGCRAVTRHGWRARRRTCSSPGSRRQVAADRAGWDSYVPQETSVH